MAWNGANSARREADGKNGSVQAGGRFLGGTWSKKNLIFKSGFIVQDSHTLISRKRTRKNLAGFDLQGFVVEHRGVEPLTSTMRMSRATNCANAPYRYPDQSGSASSTLTSRGLGRDPVGSLWHKSFKSSMRKRQYITAERKKQGIFDGGLCFRYNPEYR